VFSFLQSKISAWALAIKSHQKLGVVLHTYNPNTWEKEAGGLEVQDDPGLHNKTLPQKNKNNQTNHIGLSKEGHSPHTLKLAHHTCIFVVVFWHYWSLNSGPCTCTSSTLLLGHASSPYACISVLLSRQSHVPYIAAMGAMSTVEILGVVKLGVQLRGRVFG
jgi:hypothetical protein